MVLARGGIRAYVLTIVSDRAESDVMLTVVGIPASIPTMLTLVSMERVDRIFTAREMGAAIRRARRARGLTQVQLAEHANVSRGALQKIEAARGTVTLPTLLRLLRTLSLDLAVVSRTAPETTEERRDDS